MNEKRSFCSITNSHHVTIISKPTKSSHQKTAIETTQNESKNGNAASIRWRLETVSNKTSNKVCTKHHANFTRIQKAISRTIQHRYDPNRNIISLSKHSFTEEHYDLLNKNLNFCPTPGNYNKRIMKNVQKVSIERFS